MTGDTMDTAATLVGLTVGAAITVGVVGAIGLFYAGRMVTWMWRR